MRKYMVLACLVFLLVPAVVLAGCSSGGTSSNKGNTSESPESVAKAFFEATMTGNATASWNLLSKKLQEAIKTKEAWANSGVTNTLGTSTVEAGKATITGDTASVTIKIMKDGTEITDSDVSLVKENGTWKIAIP
ncbi:MAG: DUF4878 domain-containing protein [Candidatus Geothermincolia bacterium]